MAETLNIFEGDLVIFRDDLEVDEEYGGFIFLDTMKEFIGKPQIVSDAFSGTFLIKSDVYSHLFTPAMVKSVQPKAPVYSTEEVKELLEALNELVDLKRIKDFAKGNNNVLRASRYQVRKEKAWDAAKAVLRTFKLKR